MRPEAPEPTVRLFAGVWPPPEVTEILGSLERPEVPGVRWTTPAQWHVTLAFLGDVAESRTEEVASALVGATARAAAPPEARLGPASVRLGRSVLCVPIDGLDELAAMVRAAFVASPLRAALDQHPYRGHLTLARARRQRTVPASLVGAPLEASWRVREVGLVRSELDPSGARYATLVTATVPS